MKKYLSIVFLLFTNLFFFGCNYLNDQNIEMVNEAFQTTNRSAETKPETITDRKIAAKFVGCWSNGRGELLRIEEDRMIYGFPKKNIKDSPKPVDFVIEDSPDKDLVLIKFIDRSDFFRFDDYVTFRYEEANEFGYPNITHNEFFTYEDYLNGKKSGFGGWVKDECRKWYPKWFTKYYGLGSN